MTAAETLSQLRHALRTPLNHIIGYTEMLAEDAADLHIDRDEQILHSILAEAQHICDVVQSLGNAAEPEHFEDEIVELRARIHEPILRIQSCLQSLDANQNPDVQRMGSATAELLAFSESGIIRSLAPEYMPRVGKRRLAAVSTGAKLLVVDDDEGNRDVLRRHLERQGYEVHEAAGGEEALVRLRTEPFDGLLLDLVMPGLDGFGVLDALQSDSALGDLPVLVISASDDLVAVADSIQRGAADYLIKPFDPTLLHARLSSTLEQKRLRDRERLKNAENERLTAALQRSNEDLQRFAYAASHDLQAPVRTMTTYLQLLRRRLKTRLTTDELEMFDFAEGAAKRMHVLIQDLLQYSQATTQQSRQERIDAEALLKALLLDMAALIEDSGAAITWEPLPVVTYDSTRLRQILQNLIGNAIKYRSTEAPRITVLSAVEDDHWRFCVRDNGQGIPAEHTEKIFDMFHRLHGDSIPGSGIGLAICKRIVERSGGEIWVDSEVGRGSTFCFTIPFPAATVVG